MATSPSDPGSSAVQALRDSFGDRKPIDISRKITACVSCRKQKIKCHMGDGAPPCTRCKKRGLSCVVNRSLQMLLESDVAWKANIEEKLRMLEDSVGRLNQQCGGIQNATVYAPPKTPVAQLPTQPDAIMTTQQPQPTEPGWEVVMDLNRGPGVVPASCVSEVSDASPGVARQALVDSFDIVDQGIITLDDAEAFFRLYARRLDHFLYRILAEHDSLASVRKSSPLLTAAICAVGALHTPSNLYHACYQHFVSLACSKMFSKKNNHDDVRGFCIGAFWLTARLAGELNLHRCIPKAPHTKRACYLRTRLYYLVFVCDHHFSICYGRPPLTRDFTTITPPSQFLQSEFATEDDARLVSQVEIWTISTRVFDQFSLDPEAHLSDQLIPQLRRLSIALDTWRADWNERFHFNECVGNYPRKGVGLHYHFAKLFLCSHAFRRAPVAGGEHLQLDPDLEEFATSAVHSATSILQVIAADQEIQSCLHGLPAYFDTMIAFAFVFLLKITIKNPANLRVDKAGIAETLDVLATVLNNIASKMHPRHLLTSIASSARKLLDRFSGQEVAPAQSKAVPGPPAPFDPANQWLSPTDALFLENYDFLYSPSGDLNFDPELGFSHHQ
ncbi:uncharacterized protein Z519_01369 [Cladophialophora bantiana CBS 173.52]|uniref:Zn(2)-C6 fungal-type domain-containing protein n=1 Tax=Cladophialophora bantiana (strain ATCC 10958 / CBS 173.52 / CDC B-1940 / NIH 8579) TaxID=1442370 RepID=A0A0D2I3J3_CLAB1|nr:uncharacterized protein Z519_01369 [Cladophialophora bantiana CBS 173.52]KIW97785.1 hypothetical protein Z519_01369 [Cladophialophora bantiana CBS 173.52]